MEISFRSHLDYEYNHRYKMLYMARQLCCIFNRIWIAGKNVSETGPKVHLQQRHIDYWLINSLNTCRGCASGIHVLYMNANWNIQINIKASWLKLRIWNCCLKMHFLEWVNWQRVYLGSTMANKRQATICTNDGKVCWTNDPYMRYSVSLT